MTSQTDEAARIAAIADGLSASQKNELLAAFGNKDLGLYSPSLPSAAIAGVLQALNRKRLIKGTDITPDGIAVAAMLSASREGE